MVPNDLTVSLFHIKTKSFLLCLCHELPCIFPEPKNAMTNLSPSSSSSSSPLRILVQIRYTYRKNETIEERMYSGIYLSIYSGGKNVECRECDFLSLPSSLKEEHLERQSDYNHLPTFVSTSQMKSFGLLSLSTELNFSFPRSFFHLLLQPHYNLTPTSS